MTAYPVNNYLINSAAWLCRDPAFGNCSGEALVAVVLAQELGIKDDLEPVPKAVASHNPIIVFLPRDRF
jgi:hypothetical protein